jgi:predicted RNA-binding protein with PIN domain
MNIIIDGYNVLKLALKKDFVTEAERSTFIKRLATYAKKKRHSLTVVFDGGNTARPLIEKDHGIVIVYSGDYMSADDYLIDYFQTQRALDPLLITSDNGVRKAAYRVGLDSLPSDDFYRLVMYELGVEQERCLDAGPIIKITESKQEDVDTLMHEASQSIEYKEGDIPLQFVQLIRSKISKRLAKKIKTL